MAPQEVKIRWTVSAAEDLKAAHPYLYEQSPAAAGRVIERIISAVEVLERYPQIGRLGRIEDTRELVVTSTPFIVFYRIQRDRIELLGVLHAARKWPEAL